ncbi:MAG TPA: glycosyltransferase family 4 protein [Polyangiaceae bacterium]|nr:glycosyltransferase family 4 protein [Polyangiaceae bacterium]
MNVVDRKITNQPVRLLMTFDALGGVYGYSLTLAKRLSGEGAEVLLASMGALSAAQRGELSRLPRVSVVESAFALEWMDDPWRDVDRAGEWLLRLERDFQPTLVHLNGYSHASLAFRAPVVVVAHSCVASWWRAVLGETLPARYDEYRKRVQAGLHAASAIVAPSAAMLRALAREYSVPFDRASVIHNGTSSARLGPGRKEPFVLAAGRLWDRAKNLTEIAARADELRWPLVLAGEVASPDGVTLSFPSNVQVRGVVTRPAMADLMARASIFVHPALYEPFGLAPLEAAVAGCALVVSDIESQREIWGDAATLVAPRDTDAVVEATNRLASSPELRAQAAHRARERACLYPERAFTDAYLELYRSVIERPRAACASHVSTELRA